jgi:hypothetical protein
MNEEKLIACKDCKFYKRAFRNDNCRKQISIITNYVDGTIKQSVYEQDAYRARLDVYACGPKAKWFELKPESWLKRLLRF